MTQPDQIDSEGERGKSAWQLRVSSGLFRQSAGIVIIRILGAALALLAQIFASRLIGPEEYGKFAFAFVWLLLLGHTGTAGTSQLLYRMLSQFIETGERSLAAGLLKATAWATIIVSGSIALGGIGLVRSGIFGLDPDLVLLFSLMLVAVPLLSLQDLLEAIARGLDMPALGIGPVYMLRHLSIIIGVGSMFLAGNVATAVTVVQFVLAGFVASIVLQFWLLRPHITRLIKGVVPSYRLGSWTRTAIPMALVDLAEVAFNNVDVIILGMLLPPEQVALYFAASRLVQLLSFVPYGVSAVTAQKYAALHVAGNRVDELQSLIGRATALSFTVTLAMAFVMTAMAGPLLGLFGADFEEARALVPALCAGIVVACLLGPGEDVLNMLGEERACAIAFALALAFNIALSLLLVPRIGAMGAAVGMAASLLLRGIVLAGFAYWRLRLVLPFLGARLLGTRLVP